jgi:hypothetical protein
MNDVGQDDNARLPYCSRPCIAVQKELWPYRTLHIRNSLSDNKQFNVDDSISVAEKSTTAHLNT